MKSLLNPSKKQWKEIIGRSSLDYSELEHTVQRVFEHVKKEGDSALKWYTRFYDKSEPKELKVTGKEFEQAEKQVPGKLKEAINQAKKNIETFHSAQVLTPRKVETSKGVWCWQESRPIEKVGLYVPGGTAPLFSTVLMLGVPAIMAGCSEIILCSPPRTDGTIAPEILYVANLLEINKVFKAGGIQAIAAMTFGTESIPGVYKIYGPGNQYVTEAKQQATREGVAIDMPAGPSELMVMADESADPEFVASDLLSQAEHGPDSQVLCIVLKENMVMRIQTELGKQLKDLPRRKIAEKALDNSIIFWMPDLNDCIEVINEYAPEHLILAVNDEQEFIGKIRNAGSVFIGNYTPESAGDYASGTNHTLPTNGMAKAYSGINLDAFVKKISFQHITKGGLQRIGKTIEIMAEAEGLLAHKRAVTKRVEREDKN